jgi:hypothetical protein
VLVVGEMEEDRATTGELEEDWAAAGELEEDGTMAAIRERKMTARKKMGRPTNGCAAPPPLHPGWE